MKRVGRGRGRGWGGGRVMGRGGDGDRVCPSRGKNRSKGYDLVYWHALVTVATSCTSVGVLS